MTDLLIRNINEDDVRAIDALATRLGLSRNELLRRETMNLAGEDNRQRRARILNEPHAFFPMPWTTKSCPTHGNDNQMAD